MAEIPDAPTGDDLEWSVAAALQASGYYIEKNVTDEFGGTQYLELDVVATKYEEQQRDTVLIEVKSGTDWSFPQLFQLRGWMEYLGIEKGVFFTSRCSAARRDVYAEVANRIGIQLAVCDDTRNPHVEQALDSAGGLIAYDNDEHDFWRFAYWAERNLMKLIKERHDSQPSDVTSQAKDYRKLVNDRIFFTSDDLARANGLYGAYFQFPHLSRAAAATYLGASPSDLEVRTAYNNALKNGAHALVQACLYLEHRARLSILRAAVDYACFAENRNKGWSLAFASLPANFAAVTEDLRQDPYAPLYPYFWQVFFWAWGAFIVLPKKDAEYAALSEQTGIPPEHIDDALAIYQKLFTTEGDWWQLRGGDELLTLKLVPPSVYGMGAIHRLITNKIEYYKDLGIGGYAASLLGTWHNLAVSLIERKDAYAAPVA